MHLGHAFVFGQREVDVPVMGGFGFEQHKSFGHQASGFQLGSYGLLLVHRKNKRGHL